MRRADALLRFIYDFVVGDDWRIAVGVVIAFGLTAALSHTSVAAWWVIPAAVVVLLSGSVLAVARSSG